MSTSNSLQPEIRKAGSHRHFRLWGRRGKQTVCVNKFVFLCIKFLPVVKLKMWTFTRHVGSTWTILLSCAARTSQPLFLCYAFLKEEMQKRNLEDFLETVLLLTTNSCELWKEVVLTVAAVVNAVIGCEIHQIHAAACTCILRCETLLHHQMNTRYLICIDSEWK